MFLVETPQALPGSCFFCGSASRESYVDTLKQVEFHGAMYICDLCLLDMARLVGLISPEETETLRKNNEKLKEVLFKRDQEIESLRRAVDGLTVARRYSGTSDPVPELPVDLPEDLHANITGAHDSEERVDSGEEGVTEQASDEQLDGVRESASDDKSSTNFKLSGI